MASRAPLTVMTGATGGIGRRVALRLARSGHRLCLVGRSPERIHALVEALRERVPDVDAHVVQADLSSLASVRVAGEELRASHPSIDNLINGAGRFEPRYAETVDGYETHLAINYLAPFLLTHVLLPSLRQAGQGRVINVAGETSRIARLKLGDLNRARGFTTLGAYGQSKLALTSFSRLLAKRLAHTPMLVNALQPGMAATDHLSRGAKWLDDIWRAIAPSPDVAARAVARLAIEPATQLTTGRYYIGTLRAPAPCPVYRAGLANALYEKTASMVGLAADERVEAGAAA